MPLYPHESCPSGPPCVMPLTQWRLWAPMTHMCTHMSAHTHTHSPQCRLDPTPLAFSLHLPCLTPRSTPAASPAGAAATAAVPLLTSLTCLPPLPPPQVRHPELPPLRLSGHIDAVTAVSWSPSQDQPQLATASDDASIRWACPMCTQCGNTPCSLGG